MDLVLSRPIATDIVGAKAAHVDPATGVASIPNVAAVKCLGLFEQSVIAREGFAAVAVSGVRPAVFGGASQYGDSLTNDAQGRLVVASGAPGTKVWCIGFSEAVISQAGDIGDVLIHPHFVVM